MPPIKRCKYCATVWPARTINPRGWVNPREMTDSAMTMPSEHAPVGTTGSIFAWAGAPGSSSGMAGPAGGVAIPLTDEEGRDSEMEPAPEMLPGAMEMLVAGAAGSTPPIEAPLPSPELNPPMFSSQTRLAFHWTVGKRIALTVEHESDEVVLTDLVRSDDRATCLTLTMPSAANTIYAHEPIAEMKLRSDIDYRVDRAVYQTGNLAVTTELNVRIKGHTEPTLSTISGTVKSEGKGRGRGH